MLLYVKLFNFSFLPSGKVYKLFNLNYNPFMIYTCLSSYLLPPGTMKGWPSSNLVEEKKKHMPLLLLFGPSHMLLKV